MLPVRGVLDPLDGFSHEYFLGLHQVDLTLDDPEIEESAVRVTAASHYLDPASI